MGLLEASPFTRSPTGSQATQVYLTSLGYLRPPTFLERGNLHLGFPKQTRRCHFFGQFCGETKHASSILHKRRKIGLKILFENATLNFQIGRKLWKRSTFFCSVHQDQEGLSRFEQIWLKVSLVSHIC